MYSCDFSLQNEKFVYIQVVFIKVGEIDTVKETFSADVFIQARWREPTLDGVNNASTTACILCSSFKKHSVTYLDGKL